MAQADSMDGGTSAALLELLERVRRETGVPGIAMAARVGEQSLLVAVGTCTAGRAEPLSAQHRFQCGCTAKLLLAIVALELADAGGLDLDAPIGEYLPDLADARLGRAVRVSHLLSHTSGYRGTNLFEPECRDLDWAGLVRYLRAAPLLFEPGRVFSYEHTESVLLGRIVERVGGATRSSLIRERLLEPLGIAAAPRAGSGNDPLHAGRHEVDPAAGRFLPLRRVAALSPFWEPAFGAESMSPVDLARIAEALLPPEQAGRSSAVVGAATRERLTRRAVTLPPSLGRPACELLPVAFGLGAAELPGGVHGHNGLAHGECIGVRFEASARAAVAVGLNATCPHVRDLILASVCARLGGRAAAAARRPVELELAGLEGIYAGPGRGLVNVWLEANRLILELGPERAPRRRIGEIVDDPGRGVTLVSPIPQLSVGFFHPPDGGDVAMMIGLHAHRRVGRRALAG